MSGVVYTEQTICQDCYKCVRNCPVKAIEIRGHSAKVIEAKCIACGSCVQVCPVKAKKIRSEIAKTRLLLREHKKVVVSLAPSYISHFAHVTLGQMITGLIELGFVGVSETALGADHVTLNVIEELDSTLESVMISTACPVATAYIRYLEPKLKTKMTSVCSPMIAHARILKKELGEDHKIVFIGPCIAKRLESKRYGDLIDIVLTFDELKEMLDQKNIDLRTLKESAPLIAKAGFSSFYPTEGGMIEQIKKEVKVPKFSLSAISGQNKLKLLTEGHEYLPIKSRLFIETLWCDGGCLTGPLSNKSESFIRTLLQPQSSRSDLPLFARRDTPKLPNWSPITNEDDRKEIPPLELQKALERVGKYTKEDILNCEGCGYESCEAFVKALIAGIAEPAMCVSYMRKLANKKANVLMNTIPCGVVLLDSDLKIVECNKKFVSLAGPECQAIFEELGDLTGASISKIFSFASVFLLVLESDTPIEKKLHHNDTVLDISIFPIESHRLIGAVITDVTKPVIEREEIIEKSKEVIHKNLMTVQKIAYLLGANAAESEVLLNSIIESFQAPDKT